MTESPLTDAALKIVECRGRWAVAGACQTILSFNYGSQEINQALKFYAQNTLSNVLPIFPALLSLSSRRAKKPQTIEPIATAIMLITASGDIHDDIVDQSTQKFGVQTVLGKYGANAALLAGDALLIHGLALLRRCDCLSVGQREAVFEALDRSMLEMVAAEALETRLWKKPGVVASEYFEVFKLKGSAAEFLCKVGGIVDGANQASLESLARYGRLVGTLATLKEEFVDTQVVSELKHRITYEMPPYPVIYALKDPALAGQIMPIIRKQHQSKRDLQILSDLVLNCDAIAELKAELAELGRAELLRNLFLRENREASVLLEALAFEL